MKNIKLEKLILKNFKGIKELALYFEDYTNIKGENATGKTTIVDGFNWLLFDKDSNDRQNFDIKTLNVKNEVIHGLEHQVIGFLNVDGRTIVLAKIFKEKWTKKKGEAERQLTGHETLYYVDDIPVKQSEYKAKVNSIIDERIFKLITSPLYFNTNLKWQDKRSIILDTCGDVSQETVLNNNNKLKKLESLLLDKDVDTLKKSITIQKKKLNERIKAIPYRIDEVNNSIEEYDYESLDYRKQGIVSSIEAVDEKLLDKSKIQEELLKEKEKVYKLKSRIREIEYNLQLEKNQQLKKFNEELNQKENEGYKLQSQVSRLSHEIHMKREEIQILEGQLVNLRKQWMDVNGEMLEISKDIFLCPTCNRPLDHQASASKKQDIEEQFNQNKQDRLYKINASGKDKKEALKELKEEVLKLNEALNQLEIKILELKEVFNAKKHQVQNYNTNIHIEGNAEYEECLKQISELEMKIIVPKDVEAEMVTLKSKKQSLNYDLEEVNKLITTKDQNQKLRVRIDELMEEEKSLAQQIADLENQEFLCDEFIKTKVGLLESNINKKFKFVRFKLFNTLINGAIEECCEALINGVPFGSANKASQINAGLDIINALSEHYGIQAPIFIDNRESINQIINCSSQIINLLVTKDDKLKIEGECV